MRCDFPSGLDEWMNLLVSEPGRYQSGEVKPQSVMVGGQCGTTARGPASRSCGGTQPFLLNLLSFNLNGSNCQLSHGFLDSPESWSF